MHTILGAGGPVANSLWKTLIENKEQVRLVSRRPIEVTGQTQWTQADLLDFPQVTNAVEGSDIIYLCAGLEYNKKIWGEQWPRIMQNLIDAAKVSQARVIFFDNVYMYGLVNGEMTESTPYNPRSVKGEIRAKTAEYLMSESKAGNIRATIARAADFYGAESMNSFLDSMVLAKYAKRKKAMWLGKAEKKHSFTYVPDTGKALYTLAKDISSNNQVWHIPTAPPMTGEEYVQMAAKIFDTSPAYMEVNKLMLRTIGLFNKLIAETAEMYYQYDHDYVFSSDKFENRYKLKPTMYEEGIRAFKKYLLSSGE